MLKKSLLTLSVSLLLASQSVNALTPWSHGAPEITIRVSGAVAVNNAYTKVVTDVLAAAGTLDTFNDVDAATSAKGSNWTCHYFTGNAGLGAGLAGKKILLVRRTRGGTGYGVIPLVRSIPLEHLNIVGTRAADWTADGAGAWKATLSSANASKYLRKNISDGGVIAVDPFSVLKPRTENYPDQQNELITGLPEAKWPSNLGFFPSKIFTVLPTGGLVYGVAVTSDLYKALQAAQKRAGILPSTTVIGNYDEASMPSLNNQVIASLLAGKISDWGQLKIIDSKAGGAVKSLTDPSILADAGITAPPLNALGKTPVALGLRNNGAATSVLAYSVFINYPGTANASKPATKTLNFATDENAALPIVKHPVIISDTGVLLKDWQDGTNILGLNTALAKRWGIAINTADRNTAVTATGTGGDPWRYIRINGYAPTLDNVAAGHYSYWAEGSVLYPTQKSDPQWGLKTKLLKTLANGLSSPSILGSSVTTQAWGKTGGFATTANPGGFSARIPFNPSNPVVPFSHVNNGTVHIEIAPTADKAATGGLAVQLKGL